MFATETSPIQISKLLTATGQNKYTSVTPTQDVTLNNAPSGSTLDDGTKAPITSATLGSVTYPDGTTSTNTGITVGTDGSVTIPHGLLTEPGNYSFNVTYTDKNGMSITVTDTVSVEVGMNGMTNLNTPISVSNTVAKGATGTITSVKGPNGEAIDPANVAKLGTTDSDGNSPVTLQGQDTPGIYTIDVTYTNPDGTTVPIEDYISVGQGDSKTVYAGTPATLTNNVQEIVDLNTKAGGNIIKNPTLDNGKVVGTIIGPNGPVNPNQVTINADGTVTLAGQATPGIYTIPVTYTETYNDGTKDVTMTVTVNDVVTVI